MATEPMSHITLQHFSLHDLQIRLHSCTGSLAALCRSSLALLTVSLTSLTPGNSSE